MRAADGYAGGWPLVSVVTPCPPTVLPLDGLANVPSDYEQLSIMLDHLGEPTLR
jgi:hypothetical protein